MPIDQAFMSMRNLLERHCLRSFYGGEGSDDDVRASSVTIAPRPFADVLLMLLFQLEAYYRCGRSGFRDQLKTYNRHVGYSIRCSPMECPKVSCLV